MPPTMNLRAVQISGIAHHVPQKCIPNSFFNELYQKDVDSFLRSQRNIKQRYHMAESERTSDLALAAVQKLLEKTNTRADEIDLLIVATDTPDYLSPSTASVVCFRAGLSQAGSFDLNSACAGFVAALDVGRRFVATGGGQNKIIVVGAYGMSKYLNYEDYKIATLFADGAAAALLEPLSEKDLTDTQDEKALGLLASAFYTDGQFHDYMGLYAGGTAKILSHQVIENKEHLLDFAKKIPLETNSNNWPRLTKKLLDQVHADPQEVKLFFMTQINIQTINSALDALKLPHHLSHNIMDVYGYTGSASVGMALSDAAEKKLLKKGDLLILLGSGGGVSMAAMALRWSYDS